jgi:endonuclease G, mitochondrial
MPLFLQPDRRPSLRFAPIVCLMALLLLPGCALIQHRSITFTNANALPGLPSKANVYNANDYLIERSQYILSYNRSKLIPNWAIWQLNRDWLGDRPRIPFEPDNTLPSGWEKAIPDDYTGSGFDRGHVVPAADRNKTAEDSEAVFLMTNILPQAPDNNRGVWEQLESYCRDLVAQGKELYIMAGGAGEGGTGEKGRKSTLSRVGISVPASMWKVVLVNDRPITDVAEVTEKTRVIAVIIPNKQGLKESKWRDYQVSVDQVEALTGYDFFPKIPQPIQEAIESKTDVRAVPAPVKRSSKTSVKTSGDDGN